MTIETSLEEQFQASEKARLATEENKRKQQAGIPLPGSPRETLDKLSELKGWLSQLNLEKEALDRISTFLVSVEDRVNTKKELKEFSSELTGLFDMLNQILVNAQTAKNNVDKLSSALLADLEARKALRLKQHETLDMLNEYLKNWL